MGNISHEAMRDTVSSLVIAFHIEREVLARCASLSYVIKSVENVRRGKGDSLYAYHLP